MSKKRVSRCLSLLMAIVMSLVIFVETGITVAAEEPEAEVSAVSVEIPEELLLAGKTYTDAEYKLIGNVAVTSGDCTVESILWQDAGGAPMEDNVRLSYKQEYVVVITLTTSGTGIFDEGATVTVNGSEEEVLVVNRYKDGEDPYQKLEFTWTFTPKVKEYINSFTISNVPQATPGVGATPYTYTYSVDGEDVYTVNGTWQQYNASTQQYDSMAETDTFQNTGAYQLVLHADMKPGYVINADEPLNVTVDGRWINVEYSDEFEWNACRYESYGTEIHEVSFTVPEPVEGQTFSDAVPITAEVPAGSNYTVKGNWIEDETFESTGTFTKGKAYCFVYTVYAGEGYYFAEDIVMYVNGTYAGVFSGNGKTASGQYRKSMKALIDEVVLSDVPKAELGEPLQIGEFTLTVPEGAKYKATACWLEYGSMITNDQVEAGKEYELAINLIADPGYEFAESYILKINGVAHQGDGGADSSYYYLTFSFFEQILEIEVTGVTEPVVGQMPYPASLMSADPAKYEIIHAQWIDMVTGELATVFEDGYTYGLIVDVAAKPGYEFAPNIPWKLGNNSGMGEPYEFEWCSLFAEYSFAEVVQEIRIDHIPVVKTGEMPQTAISIPADANYSVDLEWRVWNEKNDMWEPFTGAFEKGKTYILAISMNPKTGYCFDSDVTACYLDGVLNTGFDIDTLRAAGSIEYAAENTERIQKVEVTISKPVAGDHSNVDPMITLPDEVHYHLRRGVMWLEGNIEENRNFLNRYFKEDGSYGLSFRLVADEGYVFSEELVVVVNGIVLPVEAFSAGVRNLDIEYFFNLNCQHIQGSEATCTQKASCTVCGQEYGDMAPHVYEKGNCTICGEADPNYVLKKEDTPNTGDNNNMALWAALLFISGGAVITLNVVGRKKNIERK